MRYDRTSNITQNYQKKNLIRWITSHPIRWLIRHPISLDKIEQPSLISRSLPIPLVKRSPPSIHVIQRRSLLLHPQTNHALTHDHNGFPPVTSSMRHLMTHITHLRTFIASLPKAVWYITLTTHLPNPARYLLCIFYARSLLDLSAGDLTAYIFLLPFPPDFSH